MPPPRPWLWWLARWRRQRLGAPPRGERRRLGVEPLEGRVVPAAVVPPQRGTFSAVAILNGTNDLARLVPAFGGDPATGGVWTARADLNADGTGDVVAAPGEGFEPRVEVYDGRTGDLLASFLAYEPGFLGGVNLAAADLNGDGRAEIVTGTETGGGPRVVVWDGASVLAGEPVVLADFSAFPDDPSFRGGARVALGVLTPGAPDLIVSAGAGGGPRIALFDGDALAAGRVQKLRDDFFAFESTLRNGAYVAAGDADGDGIAELFLGGGPGGGPRVRVVSGAGILSDGVGNLDDAPQLTLASYFVGDTSDRTGVRLGAMLGADGRADVLAVGGATPRDAVLRFDALTGDPAGSVGFFAAVNGGLLADEAAMRTASPPAPKTDPPPVVEPPVTGPQVGNQAPVISPLADVTAPGGAMLGPIAFVLSDAETPADRLTVRAESDNPNLLPISGLQLGGAGAVRALAITPVAGPGGSALVTLTVTDAGGLSAVSVFRVAVPASPPVVPPAPPPPPVAPPPPPPVSPPSDAAPPTVLIFTPSGTITRQNVVVAGRATDNRVGVALTARLDGGSAFSVPVAGDGTWTVRTTLPLDGTADGLHTLRLTATDTAGNTSAAQTVSWTLDTRPPAVTLGRDPAAPPLLPDGSTTAATVDLVGRTDPGAAVVLAGRSAVADSAGNFRFNAVPLAYGPNLLSVSASDAAGNGGGAAFTLVRSVAPGSLDTPPPTLALSSQSATNPALTRENTPAVVVQGLPGETVQLFRNGAFAASGVVAPGAASATLRLPATPDGAATLTARRVNAEGGVGPLSNGSVITVDTTAPAFATLALAPTSQGATPTQTGAARVTLQGTTEPFANVRLVETGATATANAAGFFQFPDVPLLMGAQPFTVAATDAAGNSRAFGPALIERVVSSAQSDAVVQWAQVTLGAIRTDASSSPTATRAMAMVFGAVGDAVGAIDGRAGDYVFVPPSPGASAPAAVASAAAGVLAALFPAQAAGILAARDNALAAVPAGAAKAAGVALGQQAAAAMLQLRRNDGAAAYRPYSTAGGLGDWVPTAPDYAEPQQAQWGAVDPFVLQTGAQVRPGGAPAVGTAGYAADLLEVASLGRADSLTRTDDQTQVAQFWNQVAGSATPAGQWVDIALGVAQSRGNSLGSNARLMSMLGAALADASIAAWDAKYTYGDWRPVTGARNADMVALAGAGYDPRWTPLSRTPSSPEYAAESSAYASAAAEVLAATFGDATAFTATSDSLSGVSRSYTGFREAAAEAGRAGVYGGVQFESGNQAGQQIGRGVAAAVLAAYGTGADAAPPRLFVNDPPAYTATNPTVTGRVSDTGSGVASLTARWDGGAPFAVAVAADGTFQVPAAFAADGVHTLALTATDAAGNRATASTAFTLASAPPLLALETPAIGQTLVSGARLTGTLTGPAPFVSLSYRWDGGAAIPVTFTDAGFSQLLDMSSLAAGPHTLAVTGVDAAGRAVTVSRTLNAPTYTRFELTALTPLNASSGVGTTARPRVAFNRAVDPATFTGANFYATLPGGARLPATVLLADDGRSATLAFADALPGNASITVTVDGAGVRTAAGALLDADGDGAAGGIRSVTFTTLGTGAAAGTTLSGVVLDAGADGRPGTLDDAGPLAGVRVSVLGRPDLTTTTDGGGAFFLTNVPAGAVALSVDGRTAPAGAFPQLVYGLTLTAGTANTVAGGLGGAAQRADGAGNPAVYLPRLDAAGRVPVTPASGPVTVTANNGASATFTPSGLRDAGGNAVPSASVGVTAASPELFGSLLPTGLRDTAGVIVDAPGVDWFSTTVQLTFPNTAGGDPGSRVTVLTIDPATGATVPAGTATVSADGRTATTNAGSGASRPGWYGLAPPATVGGAGNAPASPPPGGSASPSESTVTAPTALPLVVGDGGRAPLPFLRWKLDPDPGLEVYATPPEGVNVGDVPPLPPPLPGGDQRRLVVNVTVDGPLDRVYDPTGTRPLKSSQFVLRPGDAEETFGGSAKTIDEIFEGNFAALDRDQLFGSVVTVEELYTDSQGRTTRTVRAFAAYRWVTVVDAPLAMARAGNVAAFFRTNTDGPTRTKNIDTHLPGEASTSFLGSTDEFTFAAPSGGKAVWLFRPTAAGDRAAGAGIRVEVEIDGQTYLLDVPGSIAGTGTATAPSTVALNLAGFRSELAQVLASLTKVGDGGTYADGAGNLVSVSPNFLQQFADVVPWANPTASAVAAATQRTADDLLAAVTADYAATNAKITVVGGAVGDVVVSWGDQFEAGGPSFGSAPFDRDGGVATYISPSNTLIGQAAKQWALAEHVNLTASGESVSVAVGLNSGFASQTTFGTFAANSVAHEVGHTYGLNDDYDSTGKRYAPFDLMVNATYSDPNLAFAGDNALLVAAGMGMAPQGDTPISGPLALTIATFYLPGTPPELERAMGNARSLAPQVSAETAGAVSYGVAATVVALPAVIADGAGGESVVRTTTLRNPGGSPLRVGAVRWLNGNAGFSLVSGPAPGAVLAPGASVDVVWRWDPALAGAASDVLLVESDAETAPLLGVEVRGAALANSGVATLTLARSNLGGATLTSTVSGVAAATVTNTGGRSLTIFGVRTVEAGAFAVANAPAAPIVLQPGESWTLLADFAPTALGLQRGRFVVDTDDPARGAVPVTLVGTGLADAPTADWGNDFVVATTAGPATARRAVSDGGGHFTLYLPAESRYELTVFDPTTGLVARGYGVTGVSGSGTPLASKLVFGASTASDADGDGLPDDVELALGTDARRADTDGDGAGDWDEWANG